jgi:hypothetical protein
LWLANDSTSRPRRGPRCLLPMLSKAMRMHEYTMCFTAVHAAGNIRKHKERRMRPRRCSSNHVLIQVRVWKAQSNDATDSENNPSSPQS